MHRYSYPIQNFTYQYIIYNWFNVSQYALFTIHEYSCFRLDQSWDSYDILKVNTCWFWLFQCHQSVLFLQYPRVNVDHHQVSCSLWGTQSHHHHWSAMILELIFTDVFTSWITPLWDEHVTCSYNLDCKKQWALELRRILRSVSCFEKITHCAATGHFIFTFDPAST